ncbi:MAG: tetratricopeptide repeat protein [Bacteroidia bacterium]
MLRIFNNSQNPDTVRFEAINNLAWDLLFSNTDSTYKLAARALDFSIGKKLKRAESKALNTLGAFFHVKGNFIKAIEYYQKSLKIREELNDQEGISGSLGNIGSIYIELGQYEKALEYQLKCLKIFQSLNNSRSTASVYNNLGIIYVQLQDHEKALEYSKSALQLYKDLNDKNGMSAANGNIGNVYFAMKNFEKALGYYQDNLQLAKEAENMQEIATAYSDIGDAYHSLKKYNLAIENFLKSEAIAKESEDLSAHRQATMGLYQTYKAMGNKDLALKYHELFIIARDSILKEENRQEISRRDMEYQFAQKAAADSLKNADEQKVKDALILAKNAQIEQDKTQKYALVGGLCLLFVSGGIMYTRFRVIRKQKEIIEAINKETEEQKLIIEEKQTEILSSISYAKRLQEAILPPQSQLTEYLPHSFIIYQPKDIVAGDFYWLEHIGNLVFIAAADCTGHGVPGAMVSVVCSNALNRAVKEFEIFDPGKILDKTRELVTETFERSANEVKDGMDISLCSLNRNTGELKWAGANNPLWLIKNNVFSEIKPTKQAIGKVDNPVPFQTHTLMLKPTDLIYIFTDGYADQFGGPNGKKFKYKQFSDLIEANHRQSLSDQKEILVDAFEDWMGDLEQVDDVCIIGFKI